MIGQSDILGIMDMPWAKSLDKNSFLYLLDAQLDKEENLILCIEHKKYGLAIIKKFGCHQRFNFAVEAYKKLRPKSFSTPLIFEIDRTNLIIIKEFISGKTVQEHNDANNLLPTRRVYKNLGKFTWYLFYNGMTYRDLIPSNIVLEEKSNRFFLIDLESFRNYKGCQVPYAWLFNLYMLWKYLKRFAS